MPTGQPVRVSLADGIAVKLPGSRTVPVICDLVDEIVQVASGIEARAEVIEVGGHSLLLVQL